MNFTAPSFVPSFNTNVASFTPVPVAPAKVEPPPKDKLTLHLEKSAGENVENQAKLLKLAGEFKETKKFTVEVMLDFISCYGEEKVCENIASEAHNREEPTNKKLSDVSNKKSYPNKGGNMNRGDN